jgi:hypothetical protein
MLESKQSSEQDAFGTLERTLERTLELEEASFECG